MTPAVAVVVCVICAVVALGNTAYALLLEDPALTGLGALGVASSVVAVTILTGVQA